MDDNTPATPCTQALLGLRQMKLNDENRMHADLDENIPCPDGAYPHVSGENGESASSIFQTPSTTRQRKLSFVVTPPRIEKKSLMEELHQDEHRHHNNDAPSTSQAQQEQLGSIQSSNCRKRTRGGAVNPVPPMFPGSPEFSSTAASTSTSNVFGRHRPIHSPIAGIASTLNMEFMAQLGAEPSSHNNNDSWNEQRFSRMAVMEQRDSFLARHSFPILEDDDEEERRSNEAHGSSSSNVLGTTRALKMRRRCRYEDYDGFLQAEKELLSLS